VAPQDNQTRAAAGFFRALGGETTPSFTLSYASTFVTLGSSNTSVDLQLVPSGVIAGKVIDSENRPQSDARVEVLEITYRLGKKRLVPVRVRASTDDRGVYRAFGLAEGQYYVRVLPTSANANVSTYYPRSIDPITATPITVKPGEEVTGIDIQLQRSPTIRISGRVTVPSNSGFEVSEVFLVRFDAGFVEPPAVFPNIAADRLNGKFDIDGVRAGVYRIFPVVRDNSGVATLAETVIEVRGDDLSGVAASLQTVGDFVGRIASEDGRFPPGARITLEPLDVPVRPEVLTVPLTLESSSTSLWSPKSYLPNGEFRIAQVPIGQYQVTVAGLPSGMYVADILQSGRSILREGTVSVESNPNSIEVAVRARSGAIEGTVKTVGNIAAPGAVVALVPSADFRRNPALHHRSNADGGGKFTFRGVAPGDYKLYAFNSIPPGAEANGEFLSSYEAQGHSVRIGPSDRIVADLIMINR
jgi:hypothetical protein